MILDTAEHKGERTRALAQCQEQREDAFISEVREPHAGRSKTQRDPTEREVAEAIQRLTREDICALAEFARCQLKRVGLSTNSAEDIVQSAFLALAIGTRYKSKGRHPRRADLVGDVMFVQYLRGIIRSMVSGERHRLEHQFLHAPWEESPHAETRYVGNRSGASVQSEVAFQDLSECLFRELARRIPNRLQQLLGTWYEERFDCDQIPLCGRHRRLRIELRAFAAEVMREITN